MAIDALSIRPYTVNYKDFHTGELVKITRRPPEKLHPYLPSDKVKLSQDLNEDWQEGTGATIKHISYRNPNVLQLSKGEDETAFTTYDQVELVEKVNFEDGEGPRIDTPAANKYLLWP